MMRADVIDLISDASEAHGIYDTQYQTTRTVFCTVEGVGMTETYTAMAQGFRPEIKFHLEIADDYARERTCVWQGETYTIIRTQLDREGDGITLVCQRGVQHDP